MSVKDRMGSQMGARSSEERRRARGAQTQAMQPIKDWFSSANKMRETIGEQSRDWLTEKVDNPLFRLLKEHDVDIQEPMEMVADVMSGGVSTGGKIVKKLAKAAAKRKTPGFAERVMAQSDLLKGETLAQGLTREGSLAPTMKAGIDPVGMTSLREEMKQVNRIKKSFKDSGLKTPQGIVEKEQEVKRAARRIGEELGAMQKASRDAIRRLDMTIDPDSAMGEAMKKVKERGAVLGGFSTPGSVGTHRGTYRELWKDPYPSSYGMPPQGPERHSIWLKQKEGTDTATHEWTHAIFANLDKPAKKKLIDAFTSSGKAPHPDVARRIARGRWEGGMPSIRQEFKEYPHYASELSPRTVNEGVAHTLEELLTPGSKIQTEPLFLRSVLELMGDPKDLFQRFQHRMTPEVGSKLLKMLEP